MARPEGFEPPTFWFVARRSIQLSYERTGSKSILGAGRSLVNAPASVGSGIFLKWEAHAEPRGTCHGAFVPLVHPAAGACLPQAGRWETSIFPVAGALRLRSGQATGLDVRGESAGIERAS